MGAEKPPKQDHFSSTDKNIYEMYKELSKRTKNFPLSPNRNEPKNLSESEIRGRRLTYLVGWCRKKAEDKSNEMPQSFKEVFSLDDWVQSGMVKLLEMADKYKPNYKKGKTFNGYIETENNEREATFTTYVKTYFPGRLIDIQRKEFRRNPPVDEEIRKIIESWRRKNKKEPDPSNDDEVGDIAYQANCSEEKIRDILISGYSDRMMEGGLIEDLYTSDPENNSPLSQFLSKELHSVVLQCLDKLDEEHRAIAVMSIFENKSDVKISEILGRHRKTIKKYFEEACKQLQKCLAQNGYTLREE